MKKIKGKYLFVPVFLIIILSSISVAFITAKKTGYTIQEGDTFQYEVSEFQNRFGQNYVLNLPTLGLTFMNGSVFVVKVTLFDLPYIKYSISIGENESNDISVFYNILFVDRDWEALEEEYNLPGYTISQDETCFNISYVGDGEMKASYLKLDGVLLEFYSNNNSDITNELGVFRIHFIRLDYPTQSGGIDSIFIVSTFFSIFTLMVISRMKRSIK